MLHVHRAERADGLIDALGELLADPLPDPFAADVVAVPTRGMERWLTQRLSTQLGTTPGRADGICANVDFPSPRRLVGDAVAVASGIDPLTDPWLPERAVWPLLEVVEAALQEPWLHILAGHLQDDEGGARRFASVRHLAELFDRYALHRPEMVRGWAAGEDAGNWQAELWRHLRARIGTPDPAERVEAACARIEASPELVDLPQRLSLFGLTRLPQGRLRVLRALAHAREVHLFVLHPSPALWDKVAALGPDVVRREGDPTVSLPQNRLLASWGRDAREMQLVIGSGHVDDHRRTPVDETTLLGLIQADIRADLGPGDVAARPLLAPGDRSVQIHSCHGRARQVEVIRDAILHLLADDPTLEPRDVIVMCPDIETFAPLIQATFGAGEVSTDDDEIDTLPEDVRPPDLRVRLADRALRQTNPILGVVARLIELTGQRLTASQVLDFADREPVRRRFHLDDDDLTRIEEWVGASGIRWGLDKEHRAPYKLESLDAGTWRKGLDRVLLGVTMTEDDQRLFGGVLPLEDVDSGAIDLAGRLAEFVDRLRASLDALSRAQPIDAWAAALARAADALTDTGPRDAWQRAELQRLLDDVVSEATAAGGQSPHRSDLTLPELRALLAERLQGRPTRANFRTGHLTICTLVPMRSVPHRVVCLLGLDDNVFPRKAPRDGDDLTLADPHVGERDSRAEDRQLLLDAVLAATDQLIVTYTGNDERTNTRRPPAVPVGELLDVIDRTVRTETGRPRDAVRIRHPLQPFDPRNFTPGRLGRAEPWSFDKVTLEGGRALTGERHPPPPFLAGPLPEQRSEIVEVERLVRFVEHPVRAFLRQRLGIGVGDFDDDLEDALPVELDGLGQWGVGDRLLAACLSGTGIDAAVAAERARGTLPPGALANAIVAKVQPLVERIAELAGDGQPVSVDVKVPLADGRTLAGTVPGVAGDVLRTVIFSRVGAKHRLAAWVKLLALSAAHPERSFEALTVGRASSGSGITVCAIPSLPADVALGHLEDIVELYDRGMREPLPLAVKSSGAYAEAVLAGHDGAVPGAKQWDSEWSFDKEDRELEHQLVFGRVDFEDLVAPAPRADEDFEPAEPSRFGRYAVRLWRGLCAHEKVTSS